ncbi:hypothetical protein UFOVP1451_25 [uncultured Caudovirales phage]|uniref:Uncharacterized protein n=1 Tax=uncultured Caudovirales phage TaxID=2100421 RepID=A0A6J5SGZ7_9CAUD|nr:hypothetical protein UFOVP1451_25 [uncultured Caudovirales phage]
MTKNQQKILDAFFVFLTLLGIALIAFATYKNFEATNQTVNDSQVVGTDTIYEFEGPDQKF